MPSKYNYEELELTENQCDNVWDAISQMQADMDKKTDGEQLKDLLKDEELTIGEKIYIAYIFGRVEDKWCEYQEIIDDAR